MLVIRLRRIGRKKDPHYRIVVAEHTAPVQGKFVAEIGHYHPKSKETVIKPDLLTEWVNKGATPSNTVAKLLVRQGVANDRVTVTEKTKQPKAKAQQMAKDKAEKAEAAKAAAEAPAEEPTEEAAIETEAPAEETTEETPTEEQSEA